MHTNRSSHRRCSVRKVVLKNLAKFARKQVCQSASASTNELLHVFMLSKLATFIQAKLSFSYFRQVNLRKSSKKMVKQNPMINIGLKKSRYVCCQSLYHSLSFVVTHCTTRCHSLSLVVPLIIIRCQSLYHSLSLIVIRFTTHCHSLSFVFTRCTTRLSFYKRSKIWPKMLSVNFLISHISRTNQ